jgi:glycosyltransferase domain-containing protein
MRDFTLIISTCNRAQLFAALLSCLETEKADCRVLVLDSSRLDLLAANRTRAAVSSLDVEFAEFSDLEPAEKLDRGIHKVTTPFCALCADDDLVILEGLRRCLDAIRRNPLASAAQGCSFTFLPRPDGNMELNSMVYLGPTIDDDSPLRRLERLFQQYQAPSFAVVRALALSRIFDALRPVTKILTRELLWSGLTAIEGQLMRLPDVTYGRRMGRSAAAECWHPVEWFCKDPDGMFADYLPYRKLLAAAIVRRVDNEQRPDEVRDILDLIHLRYLAQRATVPVLEFIAEQQMAGFDFAEYWPCDGIPLPISEAAHSGASASSEVSDVVNMRGRKRSYLLFPNFYAPREAESPQLINVVRLIGTLDSYWPAIDPELALDPRCDGR